MRLGEFNSMADQAAIEVMRGCCHCRKWAQRMVKDRPYANFAALMGSAQEHWMKAGEAELLEAFSGHARIGDISKLRDKFSRAHAEQGQVVQADEAVLQSLLDLNKQYEARHGFIFIVCATGKSAAEMLALLQQRLPQSRVAELATAAGEQAKITAIRLRALFAEDAVVTS